MQVIFEETTVCVQEGDMLRNRVPNGAVTALGATSREDAISWQVQDFGPQGKLLVGTLIPDGRASIHRKPPTPPTRAAKPGGAKKGGAKKPGKKAPAAVGLAAVFADEDEYLDDAPVAPVVPVAPVRPVALAAVAPQKKAAGKKGGAKKVGAKGAVPIPRGGATKRGAVAYQVPSGVGGQFAE